MTAVTSIPVDASFTVDDLDSLPDDGQRYELVDGLLLVSPAPSPRHQQVVLELAVALRAAAPVGLRTYVAPLDVRLSSRVQVQPDVLVVPDQASGDRLAHLPVLCVEVLSPTSRRHDQVLKRRALQQAGVAAYWLVDPDVPSLVALELVDGTYTEVARVAGSEVYAAAHPFPVRLVPADLLT